MKEEITNGYVFLSNDVFTNDSSESLKILKKLLVGKKVKYVEWISKKPHTGETVVNVNYRGGYNLILDNGITIEPEWSTVQYETEIKRIYSDDDPYGEETWE